jgi:hypothetical protein
LINQRLDICELTYTDLNKKLEIVENIMMMPKDEESSQNLTLSAIVGKVKEV